MPLPRRVLLVVALACTPLLVASAACSSFGDGGGGDGDAGGVTSEGGAGGDAAVEAAPPDGAAADAGSAFVEGFDTAGWETGWLVSPTGSIRADTGSASSPPASLHLELPAGGAPRVISKGFSGVRSLRAKARVLVGKQGDGDVDFFAVSDGVGAGPELGSVLLTYSKGSASFAAEVNQPAQAQMMKPFSFDVGRWVTIEIAVDLDAGTWSFAADQIPVATGALAPSWQPTTLVVKLGAIFAQGVNLPWDVRFDDVEVTTSGSP